MSKQFHPLQQLAAAGYDAKHLNINLLGHDGNIYAIMATCTKALRRDGAPRVVIDAFVNEVTSSRCYDEALQTVFTWFNITTVRGNDG